MHILINGTFWMQPTVGSGQYLHGLLRWLPQLTPQHRYTLLLPATGNAGPPPPKGVATLVLPTPFDQRSRNLAKLWFEQISIPLMARLCAQGSSSKVVLHVPYFAPPLRCAVPVITTIGDIIPLLIPEYRGGPHVQAYMALASRAAHTTTHVLTFSQCSRWDIAARLGIPAERITPTLLAADERYTPADQQRVAKRVAKGYDLPGPFVYYVGGLDARKNVATLIQAFALLRQQGHPMTACVEQADGTLVEQPVKLVIAGRPLGGDSRLFPDLDVVIAETGTGDLVRRVTVPHEDGPLLYQACTLFAFPSRYEGFGLPPLEAMACGAPVITSSASSLPEVVGDAALRIPPDDVAGWAAALQRLLGDPALRADLRRRGLEQAKRFSWRQAAEGTVAVYEQVADAANT